MLIRQWIILKLNVGQWEYKFGWYTSLKTLL